MFSSLFGGSKPQVKPMTMMHLNDAAHVIAQTDEDDANEAFDSLTASHCKGMFVLLEGRKVVGITGASPTYEGSDAMWLSWTYIAIDRQGQGLGRFLLEGLLEHLNQTGARKLFISSSDYEEDGEAVYGRAHKLYEALGAKVELTLPDYFEPGETMIVYGLVNNQIEPQGPLAAEVIGGVSFHSVAMAPESDNAAAISWELKGEGITGLDENLRKARYLDAETLYVTLPDDVSDYCAEALRKENFQPVGRLSDFYDINSNQVWWALAL